MDTRRPHPRIVARSMATATARRSSHSNRMGNLMRAWAAGTTAAAPSTLPSRSTAGSSEPRRLGEPGCVIHRGFSLYVSCDNTRISCLNPQVDDRIPNDNMPRVSALIPPWISFHFSSLLPFTTVLVLDSFRVVRRAMRLLGSRPLPGSPDNLPCAQWHMRHAGWNELNMSHTHTHTHTHFENSARERANAVWHTAYTNDVRACNSNRFP